MTEPLVIIGCGGFGREVFALVDALNAAGTSWSAEFADDAPSEVDLARVRELGTRVTGTVGDLTDRTEPFTAVIAIGDPRGRAAVAAKLAQAPVEWAVLVHPDATVGSQVGLGAGTVIAAGARLSTNVVVGRHVHIDQNATVGHDCSLADFCRLNPQACVSGAVAIAESVVVGANGIVLQGLTVGAGSTIGAGAVVTRDVAEGVTVKGVPAR